MHILITGGAGFIGSHVVKHMVNRYPDYHIYNLDALTYAGNLENLVSIENAPNYTFIKGDIMDASLLAAIFSKYNFDRVIHLAAESHVDRSIEDPMLFLKTNIIGTVNLLEAAKKYWGNNLDNKLFYHVSTDEVYGALGEEGMFTEDTPYAPNSPYAASKASSDHFVHAFGVTYGLPVIMSNCSNNYGPNHFPEKLIPLFIHHIIAERPLPVYGDGNYTRDWLYVKDHASAIDTIFHKGKVGSSYNIGGCNEWKNIDLVHLLCDIMDRKLGRPDGSARALITFVKDRPGHDKRYAIDASKLKNELDWQPSIRFEEGLELTVSWYLDNPEWVAHINSGAYLEYNEKKCRA